MTGFGRMVKAPPTIGKQAEHNQYRSDVQPDVTAGDAGQLDDAVVLAEGRAGKGIQQRRQCRIQAVAENTGPYAPDIDITPHRLAGYYRSRGEVARRLDRSYQVDKRNRQKQRKIKAQTESQRYRHRDQRLCPQCGDVEHPKECCHRRTDQQSE